MDNRAFGHVGAWRYLLYLFIDDMSDSGGVLHEYLDLVYSGLKLFLVSSLTSLQR